MTLHPVHGRVRFLVDFPIEELMADVWRVFIWPCLALWAVAIVKVLA